MQIRLENKFPLTAMGVLVLHLLMLDGFARPPIASNGIFCHTCLQSQIQTYPPTPQKSYPKLRNPRTIFVNTPFVRPTVNNGHFVCSTGPCTRLRLGSINICIWGRRQTYRIDSGRLLSVEVFLWIPALWPYLATIYLQDRAHLGVFP